MISILIGHRRSCIVRASRRPRRLGQLWTCYFTTDTYRCHMPAALNAAAMRPVGLGRNVKCRKFCSRISESGIDPAVIMSTLKHFHVHCFTLERNRLNCTFVAEIKDSLENVLSVVTETSCNHDNTFRTCRGPVLVFFGIGSSAGLRSDPVFFLWATRNSLS